MNIWYACLREESSQKSAKTQVLQTDGQMDVETERLSFATVEDAFEYSPYVSYSSSKLRP